MKPFLFCSYCQRRMYSNLQPVLPTYAFTCNSSLIFIPLSTLQVRPGPRGRDHVDAGGELDESAIDGGITVITIDCPVTSAARADSTGGQTRATVESAPASATGKTEDTCCLILKFSICVCHQIFSYRRQRRRRRWLSEVSLVCPRSRIGVSITHTSNDKKNLYRTNQTELHQFDSLPIPYRREQLNRI